MLGNKEAEISQIKDLKAIFFYNLEKDYTISSNFDLLGLKITFGEDKCLNYEYTSPYFKKFVLKVLEVYKNEKDDNKIVLLNELTEELIENLEIKDIIENNTENRFYQDRAISELNNRNKELIVAKSYIRDVIEAVKPFFFGEKTVEIGEIKGYQNRYFVSCNYDDITILIPFILKKNSNNNFTFKICGINGTSEVIEGVISINSDSVSTSWDIKNANLSGQEIYRYDGLHEKSIYGFGEIIDFDNKIVNISQSEKEIVDNYFDILGLDKISEGLKIDKDRFLLGKNILDSSDDTKGVSTEVSAHVFLSDTLVNIIYSNKYGLSKYADSLVVPISEELEELTIIPMTIEDEYYILVQRHYILTKKMRCDYQTKANKYYYQIFKINEINSLLELQGVLEEKQFNTHIDSIESIKKYLKKGCSS